MTFFEIVFQSFNNLAILILRLRIMRRQYKNYSEHICIFVKRTLVMIEIKIIEVYKDDSLNLIESHEYNISMFRLQTILLL